MEDTPSHEAPALGEAAAYASALMRDGSCLCARGRLPSARWDPMIQHGRPASIQPSSASHDAGDDLMAAMVEKSKG